MSRPCNGLVGLDIVLIYIICLIKRMSETLNKDLARFIGYLSDTDSYIPFKCSVMIVNYLIGSHFAHDKL